MYHRCVLNCTLVTEMQVCGGTSDTDVNSSRGEGVAIAEVKMTHV